MYLCTHVCRYGYLYVCTDGFMHACMYVHMQAYMYTYVCYRLQHEPSRLKYQRPPGRPVKAQSLQQPARNLTESLLVLFRSHGLHLLIVCIILVLLGSYLLKPCIQVQLQPEIMRPAFCLYS